MLIFRPLHYVLWPAEVEGEAVFDIDALSGSCRKVRPQGSTLPPANCQVGALWLIIQCSSC